MNGAVRLIAISKQTRDDYAARGFRPGRIDVVHNGIDMRACRPSTPRPAVRSRLGIDPQAFLAVFAGRLHPGKGIDVLIDAFASLPAPADLVIAGQEHQDGSGRHYEQELRNRAMEKGLGDRCHFVGHVEHTADLFAAADGFFRPDLQGSGVCWSKAMCCETPAIGSRIGGIRDPPASSRTTC